MKSARVLTPILLLVLVFCMLALTFAWFSASTETRMSAVLTAGSYIKVVFDDAGDMLVSEPYNGQKGYDDNGVAYNDADKAYQAFYHTTLRLQGDDDLGLRFEFSSLLIKVSDTFYMLNAQRTFSETVALFDGYDPEKSHIGKVETVTTENGEEERFTEPADGSTAFIYTTDGTINGGMIPKVECCLDALEKGVQSVHVLDGRLPHSLLLEIFTADGIGTMVTPEVRNVK